jgi:rieske iron-sulfur protein
MRRDNEGNVSTELHQPGAGGVDAHMPGADAEGRGSSGRRAFLQAALVAGAGLSVLPSAFADDNQPSPSAGQAPDGTSTDAKEPDATSIPPQLGDRFVFLTGDKEGQVVKVDDLELGGPQEQVYPVDPKTGVVRDNSRLNLIILIRLDPKVLDEETRTRAADGVVAYSGVCTHQGCPVSMWSTELNALFCSCHGSVFDPKDSAEVVGGPAPRPLPALPLKIEDGAPTVAAAFSGRVGSQI